MCRTKRIEQKFLFCFFCLFVCFVLFCFLPICITFGARKVRRLDQALDNLCRKHGLLKHIYSFSSQFFESYVHQPDAPPRFKSPL